MTEACSRCSITLERCVGYPCPVQDCPTNTRRKKRGGYKQSRINIFWLFEKFGGQCFYCKVDVAIKLHPTNPRRATRDHYIPRSQGGQDDANNVVLCCYACNVKKGGKMPHNFGGYDHEGT